MAADGFSDRLNALLPDIRERREEIERTRRIPQDLVRALTETGVFALALPRGLGGAEVDPLDQLRVIETVSAADGSTGWVVMIQMGNGMFGGYMAERGAKEVFADPTAPTAASIGPQGTAEIADGGYRVSGRWRFTSGVDHAGWVLGGCLVTEGGVPRQTPVGPEIVHLFLPASDITIHDVWHAAGLGGTGSNDFEVADAFVPEQRVAHTFDPTRHRPEPLYQIPVLSLFAPHAAAVGLGVARAALDELLDLAPAKTPSFSLVPMHEKPVTQIEVARAEATLAGARAAMYGALDDVLQTVSAGREPTLRQRALVRAASLHASETAAQVARTVNVLAGGSSIYSASSFQRHMRDADAVMHHVTQSPQIWEEAGRALLGLEPLFPIF